MSLTIASYVLYAEKQIAKNYQYTTDDIEYSRFRNT